MQAKAYLCASELDSYTVPVASVPEIEAATVDTKAMEIDQDLVIIEKEPEPVVVVVPDFVVPDVVVPDAVVPAVVDPEQVAKDKAAAEIPPLMFRCKKWGFSHLFTWNEC